MLPYHRGRTTRTTRSTSSRPYNSYLELDRRAASRLRRFSARPTSTGDRRARHPAVHHRTTQNSYAMNRGRHGEHRLQLGHHGRRSPTRTAQYASTCNDGGGDGMFGTEESVRIAADHRRHQQHLPVRRDVAGSRTSRAGSNFNFGNVTGDFVGPPWTADNPTWHGDTRPHREPSSIPKLNAPPDKTGSVDRRLLRHRRATRRTGSTSRPA